MKKVAFLLFLICACSGLIKGQSIESSDTTQINLKYQAGAFAGISQGLGLSFRLWPKKFGVQFTFAPTIRENSEWYSMGLTLLHWISKSEKTRLYAYQGNHLIMDIDRDVLRQGEPPTTYRQKHFSCGIGVGVQINIVTRFKMDFTIGYAAVNNFQVFQRDLGIGLFYEF